MAEEKRVPRRPGRPSKDEYDENGNLKPTPTVKEANAVAVASQMGSELDEMRAQMEEMRRLLEANVPEAPLKPDGRWRVNYDRKSNRVHGGKEVEHPPGFRPNPPSTIPMYVAEGGGTTDHLEVPYQEYPEVDNFGNPVIDEKTGEPKVVKAPRGKRAARDSKGEPILTEEYKLWLHVRSTGDRLEGSVMSDIAAGKGLPQGSSFPNGAPDLTKAGVTQ